MADILRTTFSNEIYGKKLFYSDSNFVYNRSIYKESALIQVMLFTTPTHYLNQCWTNVDLLIWRNMTSSGANESKHHYIAFIGAA